MSRVIRTSRLLLRPWDLDDAMSAFHIYEAPAVARWLAPWHVPTSTEAMRAQLTAWREIEEGRATPVGHWAAVTPQGEVVGALSLQYVPSGGESLTLTWALAPAFWGCGYAAESGLALMRWAVHERGATEVFAVVQPDNARAVGTALRMGMEWVTEYGDLPGGHYQVYRIRHADFPVDDDDQDSEPGL